MLGLGRKLPTMSPSDANTHIHDVFCDAMLQLVRKRSQILKEDMRAYETLLKRIFIMVTPCVKIYVPIDLLTPCLTRVPES